MKKASSLLIIAALAATLAACNEETKETKPSDSKTENVEKVKDTKISLTLDQSKFDAQNWKTDNSHQKLIHGKLEANGKPVVGAVIQVSEKRSIVSDEKGEFVLSVDTNIVERDVLHIASLDEATIDGKNIDAKTRESLLSLQEVIDVHYPIEVDKVETNTKDASLVDVYAHAVLPENEEFPKFGVEKFRIGGTVKDANGIPVKGATINIRRDGVEGFSMSDPSDENGIFALYYIPEDDESHYFHVVVPSEGKTYTLPEGKAFLFPDDFGLNMEITLPKEGTVIDDKPPTLVVTGAEGALYKGVLIGLEVSEKTEYSITIPKRDGTFVVTLPKEEWEKNPSFYEINYRGFHENELELGDVLAPGSVPLPDQDEPSGIKPTVK